MAEPQRQQKHHSLQIEDRGVLRATGIERVDLFSEELITAQTGLGLLHIKGKACIWIPWIPKPAICWPGER